MKFFARLSIALFVVGLIILAFSFMFDGSRFRRAARDGQQPVGQIMQPSYPVAAPAAQPDVTETNNPSYTPVPPQDQPASR